MMMMMRMQRTFAVLAVLMVAAPLLFSHPSSPAFAAADTSSLSTIIAPGTEFCVFVDVEQRVPAKVSFQVFSGGALDVDFSWHRDNGVEIMSESKVNQGKYAQNPDFKGTTKICFSNKFSTMAEKGVFFEIIVGAPTQQWAKLTSAEASAQDAASLDSMQASLQTVRNNLHEITRLQTQFRHREARHMHTAEDNNHRVFYFSLIECLVLVATSVVQVFFVRQLFGSTKKGGI